MKTGARSGPKLLLAYRNKLAMPQAEVAGLLCIPVCSAAFAFAGDDPLFRPAPTMTVADDSGNDRVNVTAAAASGAITYNFLSATHPDTVAAAPVLGDLIAANRAPAWAHTTATRKFLRQTGTGSLSALPAWDTLLAGDLLTHTHAESDVTNLTTNLTNRPVKSGPGPFRRRRSSTPLANWTARPEPPRTACS